MSQFQPIIINITVILALSALAGCIFINRSWGTEVTIAQNRCLDGLRGYLALFVFLHHAATWYFFIHTRKLDVSSSNIFVHMSECSVAFLFMMNGFVFFGEILDNHRNVINWEKLFVFRALKFSHLCGVLITIFACLTVIEYGRFFVDSANYTFAFNARLLTFTIFGALLINDFNVSRFLANVNWSIPYEWYFYLSMPLLALTTRVRPSWQRPLLGLVLLSYFSANGISTISVAIFAGGITAAFFSRRKIFIEFAKTKQASIIVFACIYIILVRFQTAYGYSQLALLTVAFSLMAGGADLFGLLSTRYSRVLSKISYSIYLLHGPLLFLTFKYLIGLDLAKTISPVYYCGIIFALLLILLASATMSFKLIELPMMKIILKAILALGGHKINRRRRVGEHPYKI